MFVRFLLALLLAATASAQNITGSLLGNITDPSGAPIARAAVEITNIDTNQSVKVESDNAGLFQSLYLRPGPYRIRVNAAGFKQSVRELVTIQVETTVRADFQLQIGESSATVTVTSEAPLVDSETASLGQSVSTRTVEDIPIQGRNIFDLAGLTAGVQVNPRANGGTASTGDVGTPLFVQSDISINGGRFRTNEYLVDGVSIMLPENNNYAFSPNPDGTQEFKVLTNSFGPQYGRSGGGVINVVTKGGSNDFHGTLYDFFRNDRFRANNFFSNARGQARPVFHFNQFGAVVGGRIVRDKTFFFADYQGHREASAGGAGILTVPTAAERTGDFSRTRAANGNLVTIFDPLTTVSSGTGFVRSPFPGAIVPPDRQSKVGRNLVGFYPLPNRAGETSALINNFVYSPKNFVNSNQYSARIDHRISARYSLFGRYTFNTGDTGTTGPYDNIADNVLGTTVNRVHNASVNLTTLLSATRILNFRIGATRRFEGRTPLASGKVNLTSLGFPAGLAAQVDEQLFPTIAPANYGQLGPASGDRIRRGNGVYTIVGEQTEIHSRHTLVYGADLRFYDQTPYQGAAPSGSYSFALSQTQGPNPLVATLGSGNGLASLLVGFGSGSVSGVPALRVRNLYSGLFVNDQVKFRRLTINAGVRWEYDQPREEKYDRFANFDFNAPFPITVPGVGPLKGVLRYAGRDGVPRGQYNSTYTTFGPRAGIAYRVSPTFVIRAGYGIFYAPRFGTTSASNFGTPGFSLTTPWVSTSSDGVGFARSLDDPFPSGLATLPVSQAEKLQLGQSVQIMDRGNVSNIYNQQWSFTIQRQMFGGLLLEAGYAGNRGVHIPVSLDFNQIDPRYQSLGAALSQTVENPFFGLTTLGTFANRTIARSQLLRPYPQYIGINTNSPAVAQNMGNSGYHSLQLRAEKRFSRGYNLTVVYTKSKLIDNGSGRIFGENAFVPPVQNAYNLAAERAVSEGDVSQRLVVSHTVQIPGFRDNPVLRLLTKSWSWSGAFSANTGFPLALTSIGNSGVGGGVLRPNSTGVSANLSGDPQTRLLRYFDTNQFTLPAAFSFGNVGRTLPDVRGPARVAYNTAIQKAFNIREPIRAIFRAEAFNVTNTPYFARPAQGLGSAGFGVISAASGERQVQLSLKIAF
ncbi:MAG: TonB-dependent receptor [Acidobacteria bacterium]|nr:TonB-dependent receptor [Acidobacteriota bacterium]